MNWPFPAARITYGTFTIPSPFTDPNNLFEHWNTFWGLNRINITGHPTLSFASKMLVNT